MSGLQLVVSNGRIVSRRHATKSETPAPTSRLVERMLELKRRRPDHAIAVGLMCCGLLRRVGVDMPVTDLAGLMTQLERRQPDHVKSIGEMIESIIAGTGSFAPRGGGYAS